MLRSMQPGTLILDGKYRVEALIGRGASAEVYRATHMSLKARRAIKVLRRDDEGVGSTAYGDYRRRFELEAQFGAQLDSPHIVRVYDFIEQAGDTLMLVMEFAPGGSLADRLARLHEGNATMPVEEAVGIALNAAEGLTVLHARDAVHRDIKPGNLLFDADGHVNVADLGLTQIPGGPSQRSQLSQAMPHPGTPAYMSPEQANSSAYLTPASDVYSLGLVLFEMLTGRTYKNVRPGARASSLRPGIPTELDGLVARMLDKNPESRPFDGAETAQLLRELGIAPAWNKDEAWQRQMLAATAAAAASAAAVAPAREIIPPQPNAAPAPVVPEPAAEARSASPHPPPAKRKSLVWPVVGLIALILIAAGAIGLLPQLPQFPQFLPAAFPSPSVTVALGEGDTPTPTVKPTQTSVLPTAGVAVAAPTDTQEPTTEPTPIPPTHTPASPTQTQMPPPQPNLGETRVALTVAAQAAIDTEMTRVALETTVARPTAALPTPVVIVPTEAPTRLATTAPPRPTATAASSVATAGCTRSSGIALPRTAALGKDGRATISNEQLDQGKCTYRLDYSAAGGQGVDYLLGSYQSGAALPANATSIIAHVYGNGSGNYLHAWVRDADGERWQFTFGGINHTGWQWMSAPLRIGDVGKVWVNSDSPISEGANQAFDAPRWLNAIVIDMSTGSQSPDPIYVDGVGFRTSQETPAAEAPESTPAPAPYEVPTLVAAATTPAPQPVTQGCDPVNTVRPLSNLAVMGGQLPPSGGNVFVWWRIPDFVSPGQIDVGDGGGFKTFYESEDKWEVRNVSGPRTVTLRWSDASGAAHSESLTVCPAS